MAISAGATLNFSGGTFTSSAGATITGAGHLTFGSGIVNLAGLVNVTGSNTFTFTTANLTGNYICTNNTLTISGSTATFSGTGTVTPSVLNLSGGSLGGSQLVTVLNQMNWTGGTMTGSGRTVIPPGVTLTINAGFVGISGGRRLENGGTAFWNAGSMQVANGAVFTNRPGALLLVQSAATVSAGSVASRFDNAGTFRKTAAGTTTINNLVSFNNYGTVEIQSGVLAASGGYISTANSLLHCAISGTSVGTGYGRLQVAGTVALNGALRVALTNGFVPTTNDAFTVLTAGTRTGAFANFYYPSNEVTMQMSNTANSVIVRVTEILSVAQPMLLSPEISGTNITLLWTALSNRSYRVEFKPDLNLTNWTSLPGDILSLSNTASKLDPLTPSNRFYRVRLLP